MSALLPLRPYQLEAVEAVEAAWTRGVRRPAVVLPTGAGKTVVFAHLAARWLERGREMSTGRVLVLAHRAELLDQAARRIKDVAPGLCVGTVAAGLDETDADVIVGSVQTLRLARRRSALADVGLIVTDGCHHATAASYPAVYDAMPGAHVLGVTATMSRGDGQALGQVWDEIVYRRGIVEMIRDGHLADVRGIRVQVPDLDLSGVKVSRGDYAEGALGTALEASLAPEVVASAYLEHAADRKGLLFAPTVSSAQVLADALTGAGVGTEVVHGAMAGDERRAVLRRFETGATQVLSNCMVLTEGFDSPSASACVIARPTRSAPLYVQMAGRVLRPYPGKEHALVLDVVGATAMHSLASLATLAGAPVRDGQSLTEAETEEAEREDERARERLIHAGPVDAVEVDLFGTSAFRWHQTRGGLWYIATGPRYWALIPGAEPGTYDVTWIAQRAPLDGKRGAFAQTGVSEISMAMAWAERGASDDDLGGTISGKGRHWHRKRPSEKQAAFASSLGIVITDDMRALDVSDAIDRIMASRAIDARMLPWLAAQGRDVPAPLAL